MCGVASRKGIASVCGGASRERIATIAGWNCCFLIRVMVARASRQDERRLLVFLVVYIGDYPTRPTELSWCYLVFVVFGLSTALVLALDPSSRRSE